MAWRSLVHRYPAAPPRWQAEHEAPLPRAIEHHRAPAHLGYQRATASVTLLQAILQAILQALLPGCTSTLAGASW